MKKYIFLLFALLVAIRASSQTEPANYATVVNKFKLYYNNDQPDSIYKMFGPEMVAAITADKFKATTTQIRMQFGNLEQTSFISYTTPVAIYKASFQKQALSLRIALNGSSQITGLYFGPPPADKTTSETAKPAEQQMDPSLVESPVEVKTLNGTIHGTLTMPKNISGKMPVVLIIPGSGPVDRNGNSDKLDLHTNTYFLLAEGLGKSGVASVRYDKRMIGESQTSNKESDLRFDDYVDDAVGFIQMLNRDDRFSKVVVLGHSEGSLVGMLAVKGEPAKGYISVAGAGERADKLVTDQLKSKPQYIQDGFKTLLDSLKKGKTIDNIDPALYFIARPSIQRYLMSWFRYEPQKVLKSVKIPVLLIQGTTDLQVPVAEAEKLKKAKSEAQLIIIPGMNHVLKDAPADSDKNLATYSDPNVPLDPQLVPDIVKFIDGL
ncbi:MAG TPA: alpha/beta fold hydrolase [Chitinophagales bacterium]|nr:alpha/beta fold hydrolase [Chitinophagales bacterium]